MRTLVFTLGRADSVAVQGDFTNWRSVPLHQSAEGTWEVQLVIAPGLHTLAVRTGGGPW